MFWFCCLAKKRRAAKLGQYLLRSQSRKYDGSTEYSNCSRQSVREPGSRNPTVGTSSGEACERGAVQAKPYPARPDDEEGGSNGRNRSKKVLPTHSRRDTAESAANRVINFIYIHCESIIFFILILCYLMSYGYVIVVFLPG
jgi:hypothetical protein